MSFKYTLSWNDVNEAYKKLSKLEVQDKTALQYLILDETNPLHNSLVLKSQDLLITPKKDLSYKVAFVRNTTIVPVEGFITPYQSFVIENGLFHFVKEDRPMANPEEDKIEPEKEKTSGLHFGDAVERIKRGQAVARAGWNGKGMFVYYVPAASYPAQTGVAKEFFGENAMVPYSAYMAIKNVNDTVSTWVPSVNDTLAEDWYVVDLKK